jgi:signal transduction histidine kinase
MIEEKLPTMFLPAEKAGPAEVTRLRKMLTDAPVLTGVLDGMLDFCLILNRQRQSIFINKAFTAFLIEHGVADLVGKRQGDLAGCMHSAETPGGCGTTESCLRCGAGQALAQALDGKEAVEECRIMSRKIGEDLDLRVHAQPFRYNGEELVLVSLADISSEKRRQVLEKLFFHDILNTAGGVQGLLSLMLEAAPAEAKSYVPVAAKASDRIIEQILSQKDLAAAERGDLRPKVSEFSSLDLLNEIAGLFRAHDVAQNKEIAVSADSQDLKINSDKTLLSRVVGNLVKNALEAENAGAKVTLSCGKIGAGALFRVHNPRQMPDDSRLQIFQRSFSTKGTGRGLGTYSIRLLTEKYLKGKVSFTTNPNGTEFRVECPDIR